MILYAILVAPFLVIAATTIYRKDKPSLLRSAIVAVGLSSWALIFHIIQVHGVFFGGFDFMYGAIMMVSPLATVPMALLGLYLGSIFSWVKSLSIGILALTIWSLLSLGYNEMRAIEKKRFERVHSIDCKTVVGGCADDAGWEAVLNKLVGIDLDKTVELGGVESLVFDVEPAPIEVVKESAEIRTSLGFVNNGAKPTKITSAYLSAHGFDATAVPDRDIYDPAQRGRINIVLTPSRAYPLMPVRIRLLVSSKYSGNEAEFTIRDIPDVLLVSGTRHLLLPPNQPSRQFPVKNVYHEPVFVSDMVLSNANFNVKWSPAELKPGQSMTIELITNKPNEYSPQVTQFALKTESETLGSWISYFQLLHPGTEIMERLDNKSKWRVAD